MKRKSKNPKLYMRYCNIYYEGYFLRERIDGEYNVLVYETRDGHLTVLKSDLNVHLEVFDNQLDCLSNIIKYIRYVNSKRVGIWNVRRLPYPKDKILKIVKKFNPEIFI